MDRKMQMMHYRQLGLMAGLSFIAMYILMYAMVDRLPNVFNNWNQFYMAALMTAPMVVIELVTMRMMYPKTGLNAAIIIAALVLGALSFIFIRQQTAIGDAQFLRSMIPHHAGAILMCEQASLSNPRVRALCGQIIESQRQEIAQMKALLGEI